MHIAVLEDDPDQAQLVQAWLEGAGHTCKMHSTGAAFIEGTKLEQFDLFITDWELPDLTGIDILIWVRERMGWQTPILMCTVRDSEEDIVLALQKGADDYMIKPLKQHEMLSRLQALARRSETAGKTQDIVQYGNYTLDHTRRRITREDKEIDLTGTEFELAAFLFRNANHVLSRTHILENVWQRGPEFNTRTVDTHISRIRKKLGLVPENGWRLSAVYRYGYRLEQLN